MTEYYLLQFFLFQYTYAHFKLGLLNACSAQLVLEFFRLLDCKGTGGIDDIQFAAFLNCCTDLSKTQIYKIFDIFDLDRSGSCEFDEVKFQSFSVSLR
jgi:Ca2+-binding EF-hand superfamily protein